MSAVRDDELVKALSARIDEINQQIDLTTKDASWPSQYVQCGKVIGLREAIDIIQSDG